MPAAFEERVDAVGRVHIEEAQAVAAFAANERNATASGHFEHVAGAQSLTWLRPGEKMSLVVLGQEEHFELNTVGATGREHARRDNPRPVYDEYIAALQEIGKVREGGVLRRRVTATCDDHQAAGGTLGRRLLRDQFIGKFERKIGNVHEGIAATAAKSEKASGVTLVGCGTCDPEMGKSQWGRNTPPRCPLKKTLLDEKRLVYILDGFLLFTHRNRE